MNTLIYPDLIIPLINTNPPLSTKFLTPVISPGLPPASVKMPSGEIVSPVITDNRDGTVRVQYEPSCEGLHELLVCYNGEHVQG